MIGVSYMNTRRIGTLFLQDNQADPSHGFSLADVIGFDDSIANGTYNLLSGDASFNYDNITNLGEENAFIFDGGRSAHFEAGSLDLVVVPEASSALLGGIGMMFLLRRRRSCQYCRS